jgi:hypothetical protein
MPFLVACLGFSVLVLACFALSAGATAKVGAVTAGGTGGTVGIIYVVDSPADDGRGSLRAAMVAANEAAAAMPEPAGKVPDEANRSRIEIQLSEPAVIEVLSALPPISAPGLVLEGGGALLRSHTDCERPDGRFGCDGLVVVGPQIIVHNLRATGFLFDGFAVRGASAVDVVIKGCASFSNSDDGFGISDHARGVRIVNSVAMDNGYRTKGKGILVFDDAEATSEGNQLLGNRDGFTVSRRARATLIDTTIVGSFDKGMGAAGATLLGRGNLVAANGLGRDGEPAPNGDGLRATLGSIVELEDTRIIGNGDSGVVAIHDSHVTLTGGRIAENGGTGLIATDNAKVWLVGVDLRDNEGKDIVIEGPRAQVNR